MGGIVRHALSTKSPGKPKPTTSGEYADCLNTERRPATTWRLEWRASRHCRGLAAADQQRLAAPTPNVRRTRLCSPQPTGFMVVSGAAGRGGDISLSRPDR